ncbi:MAG TPA: sigma-70 family RNA polymerase sigma factor [Steroidobacter sp.]|nr:sigma-70 family RNA polymerase sigma factor [Steroidobacter sp.]
MSDSVTSAGALHALYRAHRGWLHAWLLRKTGCSEQAADLAQDTFLRVLTSRDLSEVREPRAYLTVVAKGLVSSGFKRKALERAYLQALAAIPEAHVVSPEQRWSIMETLHEIDSMLDSLPAKVRRVFLLSQIEGLRYREIAQQLGLSEITVKRHMKQAFYRCLELLAE